MQLIVRRCSMMRSLRSLRATLRFVSHMYGIIDIISAIIKTKIFFLFGKPVVLQLVTEWEMKQKIPTEKKCDSNRNGNFWRWLPQVVNGVLIILPTRIKFKFLNRSLACSLWMILVNHFKLLEICWFVFYSTVQSAECDAFESNDKLVAFAVRKVYQYEFWNFVLICWIFILISRCKLTMRD